ncbi:threonylcarbamoyl-AMP synthase [Candidatus Falkowbacteria bacterium CG11_big_fil_rev_8_21_14_0_20_39_10]|uniref:L-threonylcarbamoyladenylate synthase n=1 Tax=Candidatus Falkowbacteria bacterium CG11_big_fil_rev_8_21_14_0_20_39_10 TaxID=1974570 RepID=A0A2M6K941_9BACT|nr:MAG: threonylcarbamoyl-AMP synthase [Candidatus Falkowbacteria bacterium CG11_big_fil_rev_8_21_14_0_20_39_10]
MKKLELNLKNIKESDINLIVAYLKKGRVVVLPTDTVYGLHGDATNNRVIKKINKLKKREGQSPLLILVNGLAMTKKYCYLNKEQTKALDKFWGLKSRPTSVILKSKGKLPKELTAGLDSVGIRLPKGDFLTTIIDRVGVPIISTSLNISGEKPLIGVKGLGQYFRGAKPDLAVDAEKIKGAPSRIIDLRSINDIRILRS